VRVTPSTIAFLTLAAALCAGGAGSGCNTPPSPLGKDCMQPCAEICLTTGPDVDAVCSTSLAPAQCAGSGDQYCTRACATDSDCQPAPFAMRCLTACPSQAELAGVCWSEADWTSLMNGFCH